MTDKPVSVYTDYENQQAANVTAGETLIVNTPMLWINNYLQEKLANLTKIGVPFFPPAPNTLDDLTESWIVVIGEKYYYQGIKCTFDRLIRMRRTPFPHIKGEQLLYYFYATQDGVTDKMIATTETVLRLMDREDETAEEINSWMQGKTIAGHTPKFRFHRFKVYQLEEVADIIDFGTARTYGGNKIIIDFEYHQDSALTNI
jgi:hypothetical protein